MRISCLGWGPPHLAVDIQVGGRVEGQDLTSGDDPSILWGWVIVLNLETEGLSRVPVVEYVYSFPLPLNSQGFVILPFRSLSFSVFL